MLNLQLDHAEAVYLANLLATAKETAAENGLRTTDSDEQHRCMKDFQHASEIQDRLDRIARGVVFGWWHKTFPCDGLGKRRRMEGRRRSRRESGGGHSTLSPERTHRWKTHAPPNPCRPSRCTAASPACTGGRTPKAKTTAPTFTAASPAAMPAMPNANTNAARKGAPHEDNDE